MAKKKTSKYLREYNMTIPEMAKKYNVSNYYIVTLHLKGELHQFIEEQEKEKAEASCK